VYKVFLIGDSGKPVLHGDLVLTLLRKKIHEAGPESAVIFLGDNVYPRGLVDESSELYEQSYRRLNIQLDTIKDSPGRIYFISGNHDWNKGRKGGLQYVLRQEKYIEEYLKRGNIYLPDHGCPGPVEVIINDYLRFIFINTQWWLQKGERPEGKHCGCEAASEQDFFHQLGKLLKDHSRVTVLAGHHPLYSKAIHGGNFNYKQHLFPLRAIHKKLFIPLPLAGSLYPLYRKIFGAVEDISYPPYKRMKKKLLHQFHHQKDLIYASGHDHNLQYIVKKNVHYLISGSGSASAFVKKGKSSIFSFAEKGFIELRVNPDKKVHITAWCACPGMENGKILHEGEMESTASLLDLEQSH
jgi:hypothetical protein